MMNTTQQNTTSAALDSADPLSGTTSMNIHQSANGGVAVTENMNNHDNDDDLFREASQYPGTTTNSNDNNGTNTATGATTASAREDNDVVVVETVDSLDSDVEPPTKKDVEYDRMERFIGSAIHWILAFFALVAVAAMVMVILLVSKFGFFVLILVSVFLFMFCAFMYFVEKTIREDEHWKPLKSRLQRIKDMATDAIMTEVKNFKTDYFEYLMLTNGEDLEDHYPNDDLNHNNNNGRVDPATGFVSMEDGDNNTNNNNKKSKTRRLAGAGRSVVFKMVKPFLKLRSPLKRRNKVNAKAAASANSQNTADQYYSPPVV